MQFLGLIYGAIVGFTLGLTGGGGSIFAVPLLVYGMSVNPKQAIPVSLAAVGVTAFAGFLDRLRADQVEVSTGLIFAVAGIPGTTLGKQLGDVVSEEMLMLLFSGLMIFMAVRMWRNAKPKPAPEHADIPLADDDDCETSPLGCKRDKEGRINLSARCTFVLIGLGFVVGVLSGLLGVGGGFVIVPALVLFSSMPIHRAVATSLMVMSIVSAAGVANFVIGGREIAWLLTAFFIVGGIGGLRVGTKVGRRMSGATLQRVFAVAILAVATFVITQETVNRSIDYEPGIEARPTPNLLHPLDDGPDETPEGPEK